MCFSATASFFSSAVLGVIGIITLSKVRDQKILPLALIPLIFALQQGVEGIVWLTFTQPNLVYFKSICINTYLAIAHIFWPIWSPFCIYVLEKKRKKWISYLGIIGVIIALIAIVKLIFFQREVEISLRHISYESASNFFTTDQPDYLISLLGLAGYTVATIAPFFFSSVPRMWFIGLAFGIGWVIAQVFYTYAFGSIWCYFAALSSILIYFIVEKYSGKT